MPPQAVQLGLDGLKRVEIQWGFQDDALMAVSASWPRHPGAASWPCSISRRSTSATLAALPAGLTGFAVLSLDLAKIYDQIVELVKQAEPRPRAASRRHSRNGRAGNSASTFGRTCWRTSGRSSLLLPAPGRGGNNPAAAMLRQFSRADHRGRRSATRPLAELSTRSSRRSTES